MCNFFYYPPLYFDCFWAGPTGELSGNPPRHTSGNTQNNPAPRKEGRKKFSSPALSGLAVKTYSRTIQ